MAKITSYQNYILNILFEYFEPNDMNASCLHYISSSGC